jgi:hypothetical protein
MFFIDFFDGSVSLCNRILLPIGGLTLSMYFYLYFVVVLKGLLRLRKYVPTGVSILTTFLRDSCVRKLPGLRYSLRVFLMHQVLPKGFCNFLVSSFSELRNSRFLQVY